MTLVISSQISSTELKQKVRPGMNEQKERGDHRLFFNDPEEKEKRTEEGVEFPDLNSLIYAQKIQTGLLPKKRHLDAISHDYFVYYQPKEFVGGDFYWTSKRDNIVYIALADCTGHGTSGAMLSVLGISLLNYVVSKNYTQTGTMLNEIDKKWIETFRSESNERQFDNDWMEITLCSLDIDTREFQYSCAGGEFLKSKQGELNLFKGNKYPIGGWQIEEDRHFETFHLTLEKEETIYLYSDGVKHQFDTIKGKKFSRERLVNLLSNIDHLTLEEQKDFFIDVFGKWKSTGPATDDITFVGFRL
jgi:serine phosphatase RsbU (regulator of sigma subunit)